MGSMYVNVDEPARAWNAETSELAAVPPEMTATETDLSDMTCLIQRCWHSGLLMTRREINESMKSGICIWGFQDS